MIYIDFCQRSDADEIVQKYCKKIQSNATKREHLDIWCSEYLKYTLEEVITAKPNRIREIKRIIDKLDFEKTHNSLYNNGSVYVFEKNENGVLEKTKKKNRCYIVDTLYENMKSEIRNDLLKSVGAYVCPYCNRNYIITDDNVNTTQLDHFYSKNNYPILAISFYNLVPCCPSCNRLKGEIEFDYYPYDPAFKKVDAVKFSYTVTDADYLHHKDSIVVEANPTDERFRNQIEKLSLSGLYRYHNDIVFDIIRKANVFNETYISSLASEFTQLFSTEDEVRELIYGVPLTREEVGKRPLAKLTQDILSEVCNQRNS